MNLPPVHFGIETEIGISRDDDPELDVAVGPIRPHKSEAGGGVI